MNQSMEGFPAITGFGNMKKRNVLALRTNGQAYKNTSKYPIYVTGWAGRSGNATVTTHFMTVDGDYVSYSGFGQSGAGGPAQIVTLSGWVPSGSTYVMYSDFGFSGLYEYTFD